MHESISSGKTKEAIKHIENMLQAKFNRGSHAALLWIIIYEAEKLVEYSQNHGDLIELLSKISKCNDEQPETDRLIFGLKIASIYLQLQAYKSALRQYISCDTILRIMVLEKDLKVELMFPTYFGLFKCYLNLFNFKMAYFNANKALNECKSILDKSTQDSLQLDLRCTKIRLQGSLQLYNIPKFA